jgi:D-beta-D-heptose 7-phosphate kinase/D-beta-D-heptose 1-phosphate adenosyltransferase
MPPTMPHPSCPSVLVIGDLLLDTYLWGRCDRVSPEAPVPIVALERRTAQLGGAGNVAAGLRALEARVTLLAAVGDDAPAGQLRALLERAGLDGSGLVEAPGRRTPEKTRLIASHQQVLRYDDETTAPVSAAVEAALLERARAALPGVDVVILSDYGKGVLTPRVCAEVIGLGRAAGCPVLCDPKGLDFGRYRGATGLTPNRAELALAAGVSRDDWPALEQAGQRLRAAVGLDFLLVTLGAEGMALLDDRGPERIAATAREVFDVTGAGDTVIAALAYGLAVGQPLPEACGFANAAAGVVVGKFGAAQVTLGEIDRALRPPLTRLSGQKVRALQALCAELAPRRRAGARVVFTNGCFDLLHAGHVRLLEDAAALGDVLVVGLNDDDSVRRLKGPGRPLVEVRDRAAVLAALAAVDFVVRFAEDTPLEVIRSLAPDVLVKGQDYTEDTVVGADLVRARGGRVVLLPLVTGRSTTATLQRLREGNP